MIHNAENLDRFRRAVQDDRRVCASAPAAPTAP
jgi:hypothetical protein